ncbi:MULTISPECIES: hypothetical protein [Citrobacter]|jgi:hypothetical protein|uniref:hypothetical protein n=1 Tax=Citrobacter TaxID=544 RepID=UPI0013639411|nr:MULTISPECIES: hypothetical protein [Citrobacter]EKW1726887.1 hypothetical protein [Citrobacter freundii]ELK6657404.1 hypothetical protein [Citrobacter freundii]ELS0846636.1 hypothetical protein [Citrobacter freundii]MBJ8803195.1 hypothetical protein [Citrobacter freundii]MDM2958561.1 hypothetical protein [Citrobacter sp. CK202]
MSDLLSASSLLMAIAAILFSLWYSEITKALDIIPKRYKEDNVAARATVSGVLLSKALPVALMALIIAAIFLPDTINLIGESLNTLYELGGGAIKRYNAVKTAYCFVSLLSLTLALYMWVLVVKLFMLRKKLS